MVQRGLNAILWVEYTKLIHWIDSPHHSKTGANCNYQFPRYLFAGAFWKKMYCKNFHYKFKNKTKWTLMFWNWMQPETVNLACRAHSWYQCRLIQINIIFPFIFVIQEFVNLKSFWDITNSLQRHWVVSHLIFATSLSTCHAVLQSSETVREKFQTSYGD